MPPIHIRQATPDDALHVLAMLNQLLDEPHLNLSRETFSFTPSQQRDFLQRMEQSERDAYLIALDGDEAVGNLGMHGEAAPTRAHCARLGISVVPSHRNRGVGSALIQAGLEWAREREIVRVELFVDEANTGAIRLYERFGFVVEGRHLGMVRRHGRFVDALSMALWLES